MTYSCWIVEEKIICPASLFQPSNNWFETLFIRVTGVEDISTRGPHKKAIFIPSGMLEISHNFNQRFKIRVIKESWYKFEQETHLSKNWDCSIFFLHYLLGQNCLILFPYHAFISSCSSIFHHSWGLRNFGTLNHRGWEMISMHFDVNIKREWFRTL